MKQMPIARSIVAHLRLYPDMWEVVRAKYDTCCGIRHIPTLRLKNLVGGISVRLGFWPRGITPAALPLGLFGRFRVRHAARRLSEQMAREVISEAIPPADSARGSQETE